MKIEDALQFLRMHQPFQDDSLLSQELVDRFAQVLEYLEENGDVNSIPLLLNCFGNGDCFGVYTEVEYVLGQFDEADVLPHLKASLNSPLRSVRYWACQIASRFPSQAIEEDLFFNLESNDFDINFAALTAIEQLSEVKDSSRLASYISRVPDLELRSLAESVLAKFHAP